jgi:hypothetical protein
VDFVGPIVLGVAGGSLALAAGRRTVERIRVRRELRRRPPLGASTPEGVAVRVVGVVRALETPGTAPLSRRACVAHRTRIEVPVWMFYGARRYEVVSVWPFAIERDGAAPVIVDTQHALFDLPLLAVPKDLAARTLFAARNAVSARDARRARFDEVVVEPGQRVAVSGMMMLDPADAPSDGELGFRDVGDPDVRLTGNHEHPIVIGRPK